MQMEAMLAFFTMEIVVMKTTTGYVLEGDIYVPDDDESLAETFSRSQTTPNVFQTVQTWPDGIVPKYIDNTIRADATLYKNVTTAFATVSQSTGDCVKFPDKTPADTAYVHVTRIGPGCYSSLGRRGGEQIINIGSTCGSVGVIIHEILHALGLWHEHSRTDRDKYIRILEDNIIPGKENNFEIHPGREAMEAATKYDLESIMHYKYNQFSIDEKSATILPNNSYFPKEDLGQRERITDKDVSKIIWLYKCPSCSSPSSHNMEVKPNRPVYKNRQSATFHCKQSYRMIGATSSDCIIKEYVRKWTGAVPICVDNSLVNSNYINELLFADFENPNTPRYSHSYNGARLSSLDARQQLSIQSMTDHTSEQTDHGYFFSFNNFNRIAMFSTPYLRRNLSKTISFIFFYKMYDCFDVSFTVTMHWFSSNWAYGRNILWDRHGPTDVRTWHCNHVHDITQVNSNITFYRIQFDVSKTTNSNTFIAIDDILIGPTDDVNRFLDLQHCKTDKDTEYDSIGRHGDSGIKDP